MGGGPDASDEAWRVVQRTLIEVFAGDAGAVLERLRAAADETEDAADRAVLEVAATMAAVIACRFEDAAGHAAIAAERSVGSAADVRRLASAAVLMADAMSGSEHATRLGIDSAVVAESLDEDGRGRLLSRYLLAEAALSSGAFESAERLIDGAGLAPGEVTPPGAGPDDAVDGAALTLQLLAARNHAFQGRGAQVQAIHEGLRRQGARVPLRATTVLLAIGCYAAALTADRERFATLADLVLSRARRDVNYLSVGSCLYVAWALRSAGQLQRAAALLVATAGPDLALCKIWDRAFASEVLVEAALERGDRYRAGAILRRAQDLMRFAVAASALTRARGAVATFAGRAADAQALALASIRIDEAAGAAAEAQRGRLVQAAALAKTSPAEAAALLERIAGEADAGGNEALRSSAAKAWRDLAQTHDGLYGGGAVMTVRQRQVAVLLVAGHSNVAIAQVLFLSPRTVQSHVADILQLTGTRSRAQAAARLSPGQGGDLAALSPRQREIASLIARGDRNAEIARALGLSEKTVENHVSAILRRLGVRSRAAVAAMAVAR